MSTETRNEISVIPAEVKVTRHVRQVYACRRCEREEIRTRALHHFNFEVKKLKKMKSIMKLFGKIARMLVAWLKEAKLITRPMFSRKQPKTYLFSPAHEFAG